jgi:predicted nucleotidyltransferase
VLRQRSSSSVKIISIDRDELLTALSAIAGQICAEHPEVKSVRVFGSIARGDQVGTSDVDVIIVLRGGEQGELLQQIRLFYPYFDLPVGVDLLVYTEEQIARRLQAGDAFMTRIWEESRALPVSLE